MTEAGKYIMFAGVIILLIGLVVYFAGDRLQWFGNLPGDINIKRENTRIFIPITSMLLVSILISFILWVLRRLFS